MQLRLLLELLPRRYRAGELVVDDDGAAVAGAVDAVDRPVQSPAVQLQRRPLAVLLLAEGGLQQPGLEAAGLALGLLGEETLQQALDPPRHRPFGRMGAEFALGDDLGDQLPPARGPGGKGAGTGQRVAAGTLPVEAGDGGVPPAPPPRRGARPRGRARGPLGAPRPRARRAG